MTKKQNEIQELQEDSFKEAKPAEKAEHYEDFTVLAERLRKEGRLDEENYKKLERRSLLLNFTVIVLCIIPVLLSFGHKSGFLVFFICVVVGIFSIVNARKEANRMCYLFNFGICAEAEVIKSTKEEPAYINYSIFDYIFDREAFYVYKVVYQYRDSQNRLYKTIDCYDFSTSFSNKKKGLRKIYNVGDLVKIRYNTKNPRDFIVDYVGLSDGNHFNLLLTLNN